MFWLSVVAVFMVGYNAAGAIDVDNPKWKRQGHMVFVIVWHTFFVHIADHL